MGKFPQCFQSPPWRALLSPSTAILLPSSGALSSGSGGGGRRWLVGALLVGRFAARSRRLNAVGGRVGRGRPPFFARALCPPSFGLVAASCDGLPPILWDGMRRLPLPLSKEGLIPSPRPGL